MTPLTPEQIRDLADKWLKGTLTADQRQLFEQWYNKQPPETLPWEKDAQESVLKERLFSNITRQLTAGGANTAATAINTAATPTIPAPHRPPQIRRRFA